MKSFLKLAGCLICVGLLSGCKNSIGHDEIGINTNINGVVNIKENGKKYKANLVCTPEGRNSFTFTEPENLAGLNFIWDGDKYEISRENLKGEFNLDPFAQDSFASVIVNVLAALRNPKNVSLGENNEDGKIYEGKINSVKFRVGVDEAGRVIFVEIPDKDLFVSFE